MKKIIISFLLIQSFFIYAQQVPSVIVLDDAEKPRMSRWKMTGPVSTETGVDYINSEKERKRVIRLRGVGLNNEFIFKGDKGQDLDIKGHNVIEWKMNFNRPFMVKVEVLTTDGTKNIVYTDMKEDFKSGNDYLHIGLGSRYRDGKWHTVIRDLQSDMNILLKKVKAISIQSISFRGSGYLDDIWVLDSLPRDIILENGENELKGWDRIGKGGTINIDFDNMLGENIRFDSGPKNTVFRLRKQNKSYWNIKTNFVLQWKLKTSTNSIIYVVGESSSGKYVIAYDLSNKAPYYDKNDKFVHYGLGEQNKDGVWHVFTRDLAADMRAVLPGVDVLTVGAIMAQGTAYIDDIKLLANEPVDIEASKGWEVYDADPAGATINIYHDVEKGDVVELNGNGVKNGYRYIIARKPEQAKMKYISWDMWFSEPFDIMVAVDTGGLVRYVHYVAMKEDYEKIKDGELYLGIGETKTDGKWYTISRNVEDDIKKLGKDAGFASCNYFMVRGSGKVGRVSLSEKDILAESGASGPSAVASMVLGQHDLYRNLKNVWDLMPAITMDGLNVPTDVVSDRSGGIYVLDSGNNRLLYWGQKPSVYGTSANVEFNYDGRLRSPKAMALIDQERLLAISDSGNNRVLVFKTPIDEFSVPEFTISNLKDPSGLFYDGKRLFVADTGNNRVLIWNQLPKIDDTPFDIVLGQSSIDAVSPNKGKRTSNYNTMMYPTSIFFDGNSLYVSDTGNNRILVFDKVPTMNGWHADSVIGQSRFKDNLPNKGMKTGPDSFSSPKGIVIDKGMLFVVDSGNNRVLILSKDKDAIWKTVGVIGQSDYSSFSANAPLNTPVPGSLYSPSNICIKDGIVYVTDTLNNRVLIY